MRRVATVVLVVAGCGAPAQPRPVVATVPALTAPAGSAPVWRLEHPPSRDDGIDRRPHAPPSGPVVPPSSLGNCLRSRMCPLEGLCSPGGEGSPGAQGLCIAASDDDCRPSDACLGGRCSAKDGRCVAASDEDCRGSWACQGYGRCFFDNDEACMAAAAADCLASTRCQREGECRLDGGQCVR